MRPDDAVQIIRREGDALLEAAERAPNASIAACPEWTMPDLVRHTGEVHCFWATIVDKRLRNIEQYDEPPRPAPSALLPWARESLEYLVRVLGEHEPDTEVWTWAPQKNVAFVQRRMVHETIVHRWDAEDAAGLNPQIDPTLASDGVDEYLSFFLAPKPVAPGSVHLHATDAPGEWLVRFGDGAPIVTREHAKGDAAMRGAAADLILALWQRIPLDRIEIIGDTTAVERLLESGIRG